MAKLELPNDKEIASQIQPEHQDRLLQIGWIGRIVGTREQAPFNIAGATCLIAMLALAGILLFHSSNNNDAPRTLLPIILAVLGYLFGKNTR
ncbi:MAG TPA: hypothetical protein VMT72_17890 [Pseudolabrys sp.]|nr:hypothetical protein [Pseudolabrys sp.]